MPFLSAKMKKPLGIYVHVPFCKSKCHYCDFYSVTELDSRLSDGYLDAICDHIRETGPLTPNYRVDTVYFGGGTPSYFGAEGMAAILGVIRRSFDVAPDAEITFEANPDSIAPKLLRRLRGEGFNRVSLGVQCSDNAILEAIGRPHEVAHGSLRLTLSEENTKTEVDQIIRHVTEVVEELRRISPVWRDLQNGKRAFVLK